MNIRNNIIIENKSAQGFAILCVFAIPWIYAPAASKLLCVFAIPWIYAPAASKLGASPLRQSRRCGAFHLME